ncbi:MAG: hypothetical protein JW904_11450 [Spirochaetales bacterium]|nr:hypothetical protein [Spirochaetales bacterium]
MTNLTVRNIPDDIMKKIKALSEREKRSINNELLIILERGLETIIPETRSVKINKDLQIALWKEICGKWEDERKTEEIIQDIYSHRSPGRNIQL